MANLFAAVLSAAAWVQWDSGGASFFEHFLFASFAFLLLNAMAAHAIGSARRVVRRAQADAASLAAVEGKVAILTDAIENMDDALIVYDEADRLVLANRKAHEFFGATSCYVPGTRLEDNLRASTPVLRYATSEEREAYIAQRLQTHAELAPGESRRTSGRVDGGRWMASQEARTRDGGRMIVVTDITHLKAAEEAAARGQDIAQKLLEANDTFAQIVNLKGDRLLFNRWVCRVFNKTPEEVRNSNLFDDAGQLGTHNDMRALFDQAIATKKTQRWNDKVRGRYIRCSMHPILNAADEVELMAMHAWDVTEQIEEADRLREEADAANRAKSSFLANMSHELRTPLNAIIGFSDFVLTEPFGPIGHSRYREYLRDIHSGGQHLLSLVNDVLDFSKIESGRYEICEEDVEFEMVVTETLRLARARADAKGVAVAMRMPPEPIKLRADGRALKQILINLIDNAIKFSKQGQRVVLSAGVTEEGFAIEIADEGAGMNPEDIPRALTPFVQVDARDTPRHEGTGLGLPIAARLMEMHGGSLAIDSALGKGTTVRLLLPPMRIRLDVPAAAAAV